MAKIVEGVALIAGAVILSTVTFGLATPLLAGAIGMTIAGAAVSLGVSLTLSGISQALQAGPSMPFSVRQPAAPRQIIYGQARVAGVVVYMSTTNNGHDLNQVIVWAGHQCQSIDAIYVDGRQIHIPAGGGADTGSTYLDDSGNSYSYGSAIHAFNFLGTSAGQWFSDLGGRDSKWDSGCTLNGLTSTYIRCTYDPNKFTGLPSIKANISGKADIYDPRTGTTGYTNNAALVIADFLCNKEFGLGCTYATEIDQAQLIAAANLCDEQVTLAAGGTESRYTLNGFFDTSSTPGDVLDAMLACCEGRISYTGGRWKIYPAAWYGSGLVFDASDLIGPVKWNPTRKYRDLVNAVRATYISAKYPYAKVGYNQDNKDPNVWSGQWQPSDIPEYAQDALHGYVSDANLAADGTKLYTTRSYRFCTSVSMAQRLAKIFLMRNRQQGSGTLTMNLSAYQCQAQDVIQMSFPGLSWTNKYLEVQTFRFVPKMDSQGGKDAPVLYCEMDVVETDPSVYLWSTAEERGVLNTTSPTIYNVQQVNPPTNLTLDSSSSTAVIGADGIVMPRIHVAWIEPDDPFVLSGGFVEIQWQKNGDASWHSAGYHNASITDYFLSGVVCGQQYNVQLRAVRSNGAASGWVSAGPHTVSQTLTSFSYANVSGLGSLATKNFVDFASGDVANRTAANMTYSTGLTVEALRPAQAGADQTAGKSIDLLSDGSIYVRIKGTEAVGGAITGRSYGLNMVANPYFVHNNSGGLVGDDWTRFTFDPVFSFGLVAGTPNALQIRLQTGVTIPAGTTVARVMSTKFPTAPGKQYFYGGQCGIFQQTTTPPGVSLFARLSVIFWDSVGNNVGEVSCQDVSTVGPLVQYSNFVTAPATAASICYQCAVFCTTSTAVTTNATLLSADSYFTGLFFTEQIIASGLLNAQGSLLPSQPIAISYTTTKNSASFSWAQQSVARGDGTTLTVQAGTASLASLASATTYYTYWYIRVSDGVLQWASPVPPPTSPNALMATQTGLDGRIPIPPLSFTTLAATNSGTGSGTGGGAGTCPESAELVDVKDSGQVAVGTVVPGDMIKGRAFKTNEDVYRKVLQVRTESCVAWRVVDGHKVSPCEPVYVNGEWVAAFRASSQTDFTQGTKVLLSVESDQYEEQNYYLVSGTPLLIHNIQMIPC